MNHIKKIYDDLVSSICKSIGLAPLLRYVFSSGGKVRIRKSEGVEYTSSIVVLDDGCYCYRMTFPDTSIDYALAKKKSLIVNDAVKTTMSDVVGGDSVVVGVEA